MDIIDTHVHLWPNNFGGWYSFNKLKPLYEENKNKNVKLTIAQVDACYLYPPPPKGLDMRQVMSNYFLELTQFREFNKKLTTFNITEVKNWRELQDIFNESRKDTQIKYIYHMCLFISDSKQEEILEKINQLGDNSIKLYKTASTECSLETIFNKVKDYGIQNIFYHVESRDIKSAIKACDLATNNDLNLILCHSCFKDDELIQKVKNSSSILAETSNRSLSEINYWIEHGCENSLVFGSDWPYNGQLIEAGKQKKEINKIKKLNKELQEKIFNKNIQVINYL